jgi:hypothetical protein
MNQSSVTAVFSEENGWPFGEVKDTDPLHEKAKQIEVGHPVRDVSPSMSTYCIDLGIDS